MTEQEIIEKVRAEVNRLKKQLVRGACAAQIQMETSCKDEAYDEMLSILSDLEKECEEKPTNIDFEQELYKHFGQVKDFTLGMQIGKYFYELGCRRTAEKYDEIEYKRQRAEESVPSDLEEAAAEYASDSTGFIDMTAYRAFIAGAEWQASQMPMPKDTVLFQKGVAEGRRLEREDMLKEAVEGEVYLYYSYKRKSTAILVDIPIEDLGDKVRIVVLKEEDENG